MPFINRKLYSFYNPSLQSKEDQLKLTALLNKLETHAELNTQKDKKHTFNYFDLNKSSVLHLSNSGFPEYLAKRIVKYREKVKPFGSKKELLKIYGIDSAFFKEIYPFIKVSKLPEKVVKKPEMDSPIKPEKSESKNRKNYSEKIRLQAFDINQADKAQLQKIYGIGPAYSKTIIKYRDFLGGFHSIDQLNEVYGLKKENLDSLKKYVFIDDSLNIRQLKINSFNTDSLVQHPYISYKEAHIIVNYRKQHGKYITAKDLLAIKVLDSSWIKKITPYISFE